MAAVTTLSALWSCKLNFELINLDFGTLESTGLKGKYGSVLNQLESHMARRISVSLPCRLCKAFCWIYEIQWSFESWICFESSN